MPDLSSKELSLLANRIRLHSLAMTSAGGTSHIGSCFSCAEVLAVLYGKILRYDAAEPKMVNRDRFVMSKGHAGAALYSTLAECGFFPAGKLATHCADGSDLCGHVTSKNVPGVEFSTGSLGHGLSVAAGMAFAAKLEQSTRRVFVLLSDGECDEGSIWEAALFAAHQGLKSLTAVIDYNKIQSLGTVESTLRLEPFADKWRSFGWTVREADGHSVVDLVAALQASHGDHPLCIMAHTTKGKGVSFMENSVLWHYRTAKGEEFNAAFAELSAFS